MKGRNWTMDSKVFTNDTIERKQLAMKYLYIFQNLHFVPFFFVKTRFDKLCLFLHYKNC